MTAQPVGVAKNGGSMREAALLVVAALLSPSCQSPDPLLRPPTDYTHARGYRAELSLVSIPLEYPVELSLRLVAHGFDPNVRAVLAGSLARNIRERGENLSSILAPFLSSEDQAMAWAAAWTAEKCGASGDWEQVYRRSDVREFERVHHGFADDGDKR